MGEVVQELIDQGKAEGMAAGMAAGMANALMTLLNHRFGPISESVRRQIEEASSVQLDAWFATALSGQSLSEVLQSPVSD